MADSINRVSDEAVKKTTGTGWDEWLSILDKEGARKMSHTEIARLLEEKGYIESPWWCAMVAGGYEVARGFRAAGETAVAFHQEKLAGKKEREEIRRHWQGVLGELEKLIKA